MFLRTISLIFGLGLCLHASVKAAESEWLTFQPKLKWLYISSGVYLDHWAGGGASGNSLSWHAKNQSLNPPQTLTSISAGGAVALTPHIGLFVAVPIFYNTFEEYRNRFGNLNPSEYRAGIGDMEIGVPIKLGKATLQPQLVIPGPYDRKYLVPWSGFGVYRGALGVSFPWGAHAVWAVSEIVLHKPQGQDSGLVESGDYAFKGGYGYKIKLASRLQAKTGLDLAYTSFTWQPTVKAQTTFSADPKVSLSTSPWAGQELSFTTSASAYSMQRGERLFRSYASRRLFFGAYWGFYF